MRSSLAILLALIGVSMSPVPSAFAEATELISYQGLLTLPGGIVVPDGAYTLTFRIVEEPEPQTGEPIRFVEQFAGLPITNGLYNVVLSSQPGYDLGDAFDGPTRFMELTIDAAPAEAQLTAPLVLLPRQRIASVPYALGTAPPTLGPQMWHQKNTGAVEANADFATVQHPIPGLFVNINLVAPATIHAIAEGIQSVELGTLKTCAQFYNLIVDGSLLIDARKVESDNEHNNYGANWIVQGSLQLEAGPHTAEIKTGSVTDTCWVCADPLGALTPETGCSINVQAFYD